MDNMEADQSEGTGGDAREGQQMDAEQCEYWETAQSRKPDMYMQVIVYACQIFLNCSAFSNGKRLATLPYFGAPDASEQHGAGNTPRERAAARRARAAELAQRQREERQGNIVHAQVVQAVAMPVIVAPRAHPTLRPGEVMSGRVFEVESTQNPAVFGGAAGGGGGGGGAPLMGTVVMGTVYDGVTDPPVVQGHR